MIFAASDTVWLALIGLLTMAVKEYFDQRRAANVATKVDHVAEKTAEVAKEAKESLEATNAKAEEKLREVSEHINEVRLSTNGMKAALRKAAFKAGVKSEQDKQEDIAVIVEKTAEVVAEKTAEAVAEKIRSEKQDQPS